MNLKIQLLVYCVTFFSFGTYAMQKEEAEKLRNAHQIKLIKAITKQNEKQVRFLIVNRGDIYKADNSGKTPLDYAKETNNNSLVKALIDASKEDVVKTARWDLTPGSTSNQPFKVIDC